MPRLAAIKAWYDAEYGAIIELEDDVLGIVQEIHRVYDHKVAVNLDPEMNCYHLTEHCEDGTERLIFSTDELDGRTLERLLKSDSRWRGYEDPYDAAEREQDEAQAEIDARYREQLNEQGEKLLHAMKKGGLTPRLPLHLPVRMRRGNRVR